MWKGVEREDKEKRASHATGLEVSDVVTVARKVDWNGQMWRGPEEEGLQSKQC